VSLFPLVAHLQHFAESLDTEDDEEAAHEADREAAYLGTISAAAQQREQLRGDGSEDETGGQVLERSQQSFADFDARQQQ
jgi:hypothetical protein